jgi:hypothetical protein
MLIGREQQCRLLGEWITQRKNILILGPEGVGKSDPGASVSGGNPKEITLFQAQHDPQGNFGQHRRVLLGIQKPNPQKHLEFDKDVLRTFGSEFVVYGSRSHGLGGT